MKRTIMLQSKFQIIKRLWITEKTTRLAEAGKYIFVVEKSAKAKQIKEALEHTYGVHIIKTNIVNVPARSKRGSRGAVRSGAYKKAIVTLKSGEKIDILPQ